MQTLRIVLVAVLCGIAIAGAELSSVLSGAQGSNSAASDERALLESFAGIQPIDAHVHIYKDDPELNALIESLNLRALNICVIDDRDPYYKGLEPQRSDVHGFGATALEAAPELGLDHKDFPTTRGLIHDAS